MLMSLVSLQQGNVKKSMKIVNIEGKIYEKIFFNYVYICLYKKMLW